MDGYMKLQIRVQRILESPYICSFSNSQPLQVKDFMATVIEWYRDMRISDLHSPIHIQAQFLHRYITVAPISTRHVPTTILRNDQD